jgi:Histidine kinase-, DNA gyrase B-, and HSP90-like ATPase
MRVHDGVPKATFDGLPHVELDGDSDVLIPVTRLHHLPEVDQFVDDLSPVVDAHVEAIASVAQPFLLAVSELSQNAVEHGRSDLGCYVAAQRYPAESSLRLCIADLGPGIPEHLRRHQYPDLADDASAIKLAMQEGVSGTGEKSRGYGLSQVMEEVMAAANVPWAELTIRSAYGRYIARLSGEDISETCDSTPYKRGSWVSFEFRSPRT